MAFSMGSPGFGSGGRRRFRGSMTDLSEINIIPLVDVVLVLLIIFMLTAHVLEFGLEIDVPQVRTVKDTAEELPVISLTRTGETYLGETPVNINLIGQQVRAKHPGATAVFVRADKNTVWDPIAQVIGILGESKLEVRVVTKPEDSADRQSRK